jgi:hypothetical protein
MGSPIVTFIDYLERIGGSDQMLFWKTTNGTEDLDSFGKPIPDMISAQEYATKLRKQHPSLQIRCTNNVVRISLPSPTRTA